MAAMLVMKSVLRLLALSAFAGVLLASGDAAYAQQTDAKVRVKLVKPLVLSRQQDLDFGTIILAQGAGTLAVTIQPDGTISCPAPLTCTGTPLPGLFNIKGTNRLGVNIVARSSDLTNAATGDTLAFTPIAPTKLTLPNSGNQGVDFGVGGTLLVPETAAGDYEGIIEITAEYE